MHAGHTRSRLRSRGHTSNKNHRIERYTAIEDITKAGFVLAEETDLLENPKDPMNVTVFQQELRGHTNQFVLKFKKPA